MKKVYPNYPAWLRARLLIPAALILFAFFAPAQDASLVTWLKLDDGSGATATDSSGHLNDGHLVNMQDTNWVPGLFDDALAFDGSRDYVQVSNLLGNDFTISLWIRTTQVFAQANQTYQGTGLVWSDVAGVGNDFILGLTQSSTGVNRASFFTGNPDTSINGTSSVNLGGWTHIAATREKAIGRIRLFVRGALEAETNAGTNTLQANPQIHIGGNTLDGRYFAGTLDDLRLYDRALSPTEIAALASTGPTNQPPVAGTDHLNAASNTASIWPAAVLLANDLDPSGFALYVAGVSAVTASGGAASFQNGAITYRPPPNYLGTDSFTYTITNAYSGIATGLVMVTVTPYGWQPGTAPIMTRWAASVSPVNAHPEYPRPQLTRPDWLNLNGLWEYSVTSSGAAEPTNWFAQILVPFPIESALSGVMQPLTPSDKLWYHRTFTVPGQWAGKRVVLHFGAVDWDTTVWVNGTRMGTHRGGYDGFEFDITDALGTNSTHELVVGVLDPTDSGDQPRGKQVLNPGGIWYTATSGIWQTVWLEPVGPNSIIDLKLVPDVDAQSLRLTAAVRGDTNNLSVQATAWDGENLVGMVSGPAGGELVLKLPYVKLWWPDAPFLYDLQVTLVKNGTQVDQVGSYFGMRKIRVAPDDSGFQRLWLNDQPLFELGPLDQGFWPDGLYTAPTDDALRSDIDVLKQLGFNAVRKHVKVEPDSWYAWCDRIGLLVWQDMPSANNSTAAGQQQFQLELERLVEGRWNHPCIIMWVPFNEGWGQFNTATNVALVQSLDPSRLVDNASGWTDTGAGNVHDVHVYPGPGAPAPEAQRAGVLGEFGGLGHVVTGHCWNEAASWGYQSYADTNSLTAAYTNLLGNVRGLTSSQGLSAAIYTQTSDVEVEVNGLMTYDRAVIKMTTNLLISANRAAYLVPPTPATQTVLSPTSQLLGVLWRYTTNTPPSNWAAPGFADSGWITAPGGFGTAGTPGSIVRTTWNSADIWLRRTFSAPDLSGANVMLTIHHDEGAEVYINGTLAFSVGGYTTTYEDVGITPAARAAIQPLNNILAVHCHQTAGGQYIDAGLSAVTYSLKLDLKEFGPDLRLSWNASWNALLEGVSQASSVWSPVSAPVLTNGGRSEVWWPVTNAPGQLFRLRLN